MLHTSLPVVESFQAEYLEYYGVFPMAVEDGKLRLAAVGTPEVEVLQDLARTFGAEPQIEEVDR